MKQEVITNSLTDQKNILKYCDLVEKFLNSRYIRGCSMPTIKSYKNCLMVFPIYCACGISEINKEVVEGYIVWLRKRTLLGVNAGTSQLSSISVASYLKDFRIFLKWCFENGYIDTEYNKFCRIKRPRTPVLRILSNNEIMTVMRNTHGVYRGVITVMLECGLRVGEILNLRSWDVHDDHIMVNGKSGPRIVPINGLIKESIDLFIGSIITYDSIKSHIWRLQEKIGIKLNAHLFRHTYATHFIMNGGDVLVLSQLLGHSSVSVTQIYVHLAEAYMLQKNLKYSPLSNIKREV